MKLYNYNNLAHYGEEISCSLGVYKTIKYTNVLMVIVYNILKYI